MLRRVSFVAVSILLSSVLAACEDDAGDRQDPVGTPGKPVVLEFMAYGSADELRAYDTMVRSFNADHPNVSVSLVKVDNQNQALKQLREGDVPDVFLLSRRDLAEVADNRLNQPLGELLDARGIDFADLYKRDSIQAFSYQDELQCMPYGISPMVIYYNTKLIDFDTMADQGLPHPASQNLWTLEQFAAAAQFASRRGVKGVYIEPSLRGLAPFIYSGGGDLFDDDHEPTMLALASDDSRAALDRTLEVLRDSHLTPTPKQLRRESALSRFKTGQLAMIAGFRTLVPELRRTPSLAFDVMPMPAVGDEKTIGDVVGLCLSASATSVGDAADFITHAISSASVSEVAAAGYLVPSNNEVAESEAFLQRDRLPAHAEVFVHAVRDVVIPPLIPSWTKLEAAVHDAIYEMFYARVFDLDELTAEIDDLSKPALKPDEAETDK